MESDEDTTAVKKSGNQHLSFQSLGVPKVLCDSCERLKWKTPTAIQRKAIPIAIQGNDIIGLSETGSGKTAAFALPVLHALLQNPRRLAALILAPVREVAIQIGEQFDSLGSHLGIETTVIVGGVPRKKQVDALYSKPHVIIATPGRLVDHLENTKGFNDMIKAIRFLVIDEADRLLDMEFQDEVDKILEIKPQDVITYLYSATMTDKVEKLQRAALTNPVKVEVSAKYQTVENLKQFMTFCGHDEDKDCYLVHILNKNRNLSVIVFCGTIENTQRIAMLLSNVGFQVGSIHGKMGQTTRLNVIQQFKEKRVSIIVATDVASRGLDIPHVDVVINMDIPTPKLYIHRVGRTARAGRDGKAITIVSASDAQSYLLIEATALQKKLPKYEIVHEEAMTFKKRVEQALTRGEQEKECIDEDGNKRKFVNEDDLHESIEKKKKKKLSVYKKRKLRRKQKLKRKQKS